MPELSRSRTRSLTVLAALAALGVAAVGSAWGATPQAAAQARLIPGVPEKIMTLPAPLVTRLRTTKQRANVQELQQVYFIRNGIPHLRSRGAEIRLLPLDKMEIRPTAAQIQTSQVLVGPVAKYRDYIMRKPIRIPTSPPDAVDRRPQQTSIKDQNPRGTCYAFASIAGLEAAYGGGSLDLSENYANYWFMRHESKGCKSDGVGAFDWGSIVRDHGVCTETICPYLLSPFPGYCNNGTTPSPAKRTDANNHDPYRIKTYTALWRDESVGDSGAYINNPYYLRSVLASGKEVVIGLFVAGWTDATMNNVIDVRLGGDGNPLPASGGHVMLVVGYDHPHEYFIVKNSWGSGRGHAGYLYMTYDYMRTYAQLGYVINEVQPVIRAMPPRLMRRVE